MAYIPEIKDRNYFFHALEAGHAMGELMQALVVNGHKYNHVPPDDIHKYIEKVKEKLNMLEQKYSEEYKKVSFKMEH